MKTVFWGIVKEFMDELKTNSTLQVDSIKTPLPLNKREKEQVKTVTPNNIFEFHNEMNGLQVVWEGKKIKTPDVKGSIKILSAQETLQDWQGVVYFDFTPTADRIRNFHPIDFFIDEACVGAFLNEEGKQDSSLYFYSFEGTPVNLHLNISAYIKMMLAAKGFLYWQYALIEIEEGKENPVSARFKEWMPKLFTKFSWDEFVLLYKQLRSA